MRRKNLSGLHKYEMCNLFCAFDTVYELLLCFCFLNTAVEFLNEHQENIYVQDFVQ